MASETQKAETSQALQLKSFLERADVVENMAKHARGVMTADDLTRLALMAASRQPQIAQCTHTSVLRALKDAAELGIRPGGVQGRGYLVPRARNYKDAHGKWVKELECHFDPGYRGLMDVARRSGEVTKIEAHVVYAKDQFSILNSPFTVVRHEPSPDPDPGEIVAAYAAAQFRDGSFQIEVVPRRDLDQIRALGAENGPWKEWGPQMARKTAVRRLCKFLPFDKALEKAMELAAEVDTPAPPAPALQVDAMPPVKAMAGRIRERMKKAEPEPEKVVVPGEDGVLTAEQEAALLPLDRGDDPDSY